MRNSWSILAVCACVGALAACSTGDDPGAAGEDPDGDTHPMTMEWEELVERASAEGGLVWYSSNLESTMATVAAEFEQTYGIPVTFERMSSGDLGQRVQADARGSGVIGADVIGPTPDSALTEFLLEEGLIDPIDVGDLEGFPARFMQGEASAVCQVQVPVIGYNTEVLGDFTPREWADLLDPRASGLTMINDPSSSLGWAQVWSTVLNDDGLGEEFISAVSHTQYQRVASSLVGAEQLIAGQGGLLVAGIPSLLDPAIADGQPIGYFFPVDPSPVLLNYCALPAGTANPHAGALFFRWLLGQAGQTVLNVAEISASPLGDIEGAVPLPATLTQAPPADQVRDELPRILELLDFH